MLKMSPFLTFLLYCMFVGFSVYYLTKDNLDEKSRYILIGVLILPYIFMDQISHFSNSDSTNENIKTVEPTQFQNEHYSNFNVNKTEQPKIVLNENEKVENIKAIEEINNKKKLKETFESSQKTFTL